jgi:hypothetical protein
MKPCQICGKEADTNNDMISCGNAQCWNFGIVYSKQRWEEMTTSDVVMYLFTKLDAKAHALEKATQKLLNIIGETITYCPPIKQQDIAERMREIRDQLNLKWHLSNMEPTAKNIKRRMRHK